MIFRLLISIAVFHFAHGISLSCVPGVPKYQSSMTCTCTNPTKNGVEWRRNSQIVTTCSGTVDDCFPPSLEYTSSVSSNEFYSEVSPYSYTDCATYSCRDLSTGEEVSTTTSIADFDQTSITAEEPGANTNGQVKVITGCVFPTNDITVTWYKIENGKEEDFTSSRPSPIQSSNRSDCTRTCNIETDKKVESGFTHTEYTGSDYVEVEYKVTVTHNLYIDEVFTWTSSKYRLKAGLDCQKDCEDRVIVSIVFSGLSGIIFLIVFCIAIKKSEKLKWNVFLVAACIIIFVPLIISLAISISVLADGGCKDCEDWILNSAIAFVVIPIVCVVVATVVFLLVYLDVIKLRGNDGKFGRNNGRPDHETHPKTALSDCEIEYERANSDCEVSRKDVHVQENRDNFSGRANSDCEVSRKDVHVQENRDNFSGRPMPPIPLTDKKGRGLSDYYDDDHPMITVGIPDKRAGDLGPLDEEPRKKKKKKRKQVNDDDDE